MPFNFVKKKLSVTGIGMGIILICLGFFETNFLSPDAQKSILGSSRGIGLWLLAAGTVLISAAVISLARAVTEWREFEG